MRSEDSRNFSGHPYIGRIARSSLLYSSAALSDINVSRTVSVATYLRCVRGSFIERFITNFPECLREKFLKPDVWTRM